MYTILDSIKTKNKNKISTRCGFTHEGFSNNTIVYNQKQQQNVHDGCGIMWVYNLEHRNSLWESQTVPEKGLK